MSKIRVGVADDHPLMREGVRGLLENAPDIEVVGGAATGQEALRLVEEEEPDVLVLDMDFGSDFSGVDVAREMARLGRRTRILVLSGHDDDFYVVGAISAGARGYLKKDEELEGVVAAVRQVARGQIRKFSESVVEKVVDASMGGAAAKLTPREREVLSLVGRCRENKEIAEALHLSEQVVKNYIKDLYKKTATHSRPKLIGWAWDHGFGGKRSV